MKHAKPGIWRDWSDVEFQQLEAHVRRLEQQRDAAVEALCLCLRYTQHGFQEDVANAANIAPDSAVAKVREVLKEIGK